MLFNPLKVEELDKFKTKAPITYYVNATTGSDDNDGLTANTAFKTIQHAIDILPKWLEHRVSIKLAPGTYGGISIAGFHGKSYGVGGTRSGGVLQISGGSSSHTSTSDGGADNYVVNGVYVGQNSAQIVLTGMMSAPTLNAGDMGTAAFAFRGATYVELYNCTARGTSDSADGEAGFVAEGGGQLHMGWCGAYNVEIGVGVGRLSTAFAAAMHGSGVAQGYHAHQCGTIYQGHAWGSGNTYTCTTMYYSDHAGLVVNSSGELA